MIDCKTKIDLSIYKKKPRLTCLQALILSCDEDPISFIRYKHDNLCYLEEHNIPTIFEKKFHQFLARLVDNKMDVFENDSTIYISYYRDIKSRKDIVNMRLQLSTNRERSLNLLNRIYISSTSFRAWLAEKNYQSHFFEVDDGYIQRYNDRVLMRSKKNAGTEKEKLSSKPLYLNKEFDDYAPKLALAIDTYNYLITNKETCIKGKVSTYKKAAIKYVRENAERFNIPNKKHKDDKNYDCPSQVEEQISMIVNFAEQKYKKK